MQQPACPCAPLLLLCMLCGQPLLPRGEDRAKPAGMGRELGVSWLCATFSWLSVLTGGKEGGCCVSDWWGQVCGLGIECCRTDVLLAHPALSAARPPALRTRLIGTPNCPYEYFRGEQEWEFRVGGMVSRALTANDPLNNQSEREHVRERERQRGSKNRKIFNNLFFCSVVSSVISLWHLFFMYSRNAVHALILV